MLVTLHRWQLRQASTPAGVSKPVDIKMRIINIYKALTTCQALCWTYNM